MSQSKEFANFPPDASPSELLHKRWESAGHDTGLPTGYTQAEIPRFAPPEPAAPDRGLIGRYAHLMYLSPDK